MKLKISKLNWQYAVMITTVAVCLMGLWGCEKEDPKEPLYDLITPNNTTNLNLMVLSILQDDRFYFLGINDNNDSMFTLKYPPDNYPNVIFVANNYCSHICQIEIFNKSSNDKTILKRFYEKYGLYWVYYSIDSDYMINPYLSVKDYLSKTGSYECINMGQGTCPNCY